MITRTALGSISNSSTDNSLEICKVLRPAVRKGLHMHDTITIDSFKEKANRGRFFVHICCCNFTTEVPHFIETA